MIRGLTLAILVVALSFFLLLFMLLGWSWMVLHG